MSGVEGRVAVVSGGSSGIGWATCLALVRGGARVALVGRNPDRVRAKAAELERESGGGALDLALDIRNEDDAEQMAARVLAEFGRIDILVACAAVGAGERRGIPRPVAQTAVVDWDFVLDTNLRGTFLSDRAVLPAMIDQGVGDIVHLSSAPAGIRGQPFASPYSASKFGVNALSEALAQEVRDMGIRVHLVFPGLVDTPLVRATRLAPRFGRPLAADRVADHIVWLVGLPRDIVLQPSRRYGHTILRGAL